MNLNEKDILLLNQLADFFKEKDGFKLNKKTLEYLRSNDNYYLSITTLIKKCESVVEKQDKIRQRAIEYNKNNKELHKIKSALSQAKKLNNQSLVRKWEMELQKYKLKEQLNAQKD